MSGEPAPATHACLNCGTPLAGPFCGACGQRDVPPYPTLRELVGDAWDELVGWDGRLWRTLRALIVPGRLTVESLQGWRRRYVSPFRVYLSASVLYFAINAVAPDLQVTIGGEQRPVRFGVWTPAGSATGGQSALTPAQQAEIQRELESLPPVARAAIQKIGEDQVGAQERFIEMLPRMFFVLVPVFAAICAGLYRRRPFSQHLIFALHIHAVFFLSLALVDLITITRLEVVSAAAGVLAMIGLVVYALLAWRRVYGASWTATIVKAMAAGAIYLAILLPALLAALVAAAYLR